MPGLNLFIDTNIFLNLYEHSADGVEEIDRLSAAIDEGGLALHVPKHLLNELERNREAKLKIAATEFQKAAFPEKIPRHMLGTQVAKDYADAVKKAKAARKILVGTATAHALQNKLSIDLKYAELFGKATLHDEAQGIFALALERNQKGNPPGKSGSVGDQYNWETLLDAAPNADLHIVSADGDFVSPLGEQDRPLAFLAREWSERKQGTGLLVYKSIKQFLSHYDKVKGQESEIGAATNEADHAGADEQPALAVIEGEEAGSAVQPARDPLDIDVDQLRAEVEAMVPGFGPTVGAEPEGPALTDEQQAQKAEAVERLVHSGSFQTTHEAIAALNQIQSSLTASDAEQLLRAANDNNQIYWIIGDSDVYSFFNSLFTDHFLEVPNELIAESIDLLGLAPEPTDEEAP